jgi:hypothetical protein
LLGVDTDTINKWIEKGLLSAWELPNGYQRVSRAMVLAMAKPVEMEAEKSAGVKAIEQRDRENAAVLKTLR